MKPITPDQIRTALSRSGYLLEDRVNKALIAKKWYVELNPRFRDLYSNIEREIDICGYKNFGPSEYHLDAVASTLVIECLNNNTPIVFFNNLYDRISRIAALNFSVLNDNFSTILSRAQRNLPKDDKHVFSSQYCSFHQVEKLKKIINEGWIAHHPEEKHNSAMSLFGYIQYHKDTFKERTQQESQLTGYYYRPLIILQGELLAVKQSTELEIFPAQHVKYQVSKTDNAGKYFDIDVIQEEYLNEYLDKLSVEDKEIELAFYRDRDLLVNS